MKSFILGLISDTHGLLRPDAMSALKGSDAIIHAGDVGHHRRGYPPAAGPTTGGRGEAVAAADEVSGVFASPGRRP